MGCCLSRKNKRKRRITQITANENCLKSEQNDLDTTEIFLRDASHLTIKLTINADDSTTYTISRPRNTQKSSVEIVNGENKISITNTPNQRANSEPPINAVKPNTDKPAHSEQSPAPSPTAVLYPAPSPTAVLYPTPSPTAVLYPTPSPTAVLYPTPQTEPVASEKETSKETEPATSSQLLPHPPLCVPSELRRQRLRSQTQTISLSSTDPSSSTLSTESSSLLNPVSSTALLSPSTSSYDTESPIGSLSPAQTTDKNSSQSLPSAFPSKQNDTQFSSLPTGDSAGHFLKNKFPLITSTPPLPPMHHRTPITPLCHEGTPLRIPIYENGDKRSFASFPKRVKLPRRFQGHFRCKECLCDWTLIIPGRGGGRNVDAARLTPLPAFPTDSTLWNALPRLQQSRTQQRTVCGANT